MRVSPPKGSPSDRQATGRQRDRGTRSRRLPAGAARYVRPRSGVADPFSDKPLPTSLGRRGRRGYQHGHAPVRPSARVSSSCDAAGPPSALQMARELRECGSDYATDPRSGSSAISGSDASRRSVAWVDLRASRALEQAAIRST